MTISSLKNENLFDISDDQLGNLLFHIAVKEKRLIYRKRNEYRSHKVFNSIYDETELLSILGETISRTVNAFKAYKCKVSGEEIPSELNINLGDSINFDSIGMLTGYMITAFHNNVSKDYSKYKANKRSGETVSCDINEDNSDENKEQITNFNQMKTDSIDDFINEKEYKLTIGKIFSFLRQYDRKKNEMEESKRKTDLPYNKKSRLAYLFILLIHPTYKGRYKEIKKRINISQYLYNEKKDELIVILKRVFKDDLAFIFDYITSKERTFGETIRPKRSSNYFDQSCDTTEAYEVQKISKNKSKVILHYQLTRINNGRLEVLLEWKEAKNVLNKNIELAKETLASKGQETKEYFKNLAENRKLKAIRDIYC